MPLALGETLERRYKIDKKLGEGGFGAVYRAYDARLNVLCAVKESFDSSADAARQFKRGAEMLAGLRHPHLPRVTDFFDIPNKGLYLVMDFVQGEDLLSRIQRLRQPLPEDQVVVWLRQICDALSYIHSQNPPVIHRDIKPQNIIIDQNGKAILVDFGLAKLYESGQRTSLGARGLTPGFAPVEQYGSGATDARSDIYSLGATAYAMLTAQAPPESIQRVVNSEPTTSPRGLNRSISEPLSDAIMQALEIDPRRRPQTAREFLTNSALSKATNYELDYYEKQSSLNPAYIPVINHRLADTENSDQSHIINKSPKSKDVFLERFVDFNQNPVKITRDQFLAAGRFWMIRGGIKENGTGRPVNAENVNNWIKTLDKYPSLLWMVDTSKIDDLLPTHVVQLKDDDKINDEYIERVLDSKKAKVTKSQFLAAGRFWMVRGGIKENGDGRKVTADNINNWIGVLKRNPGMFFVID